MSVGRNFCPGPSSSLELSDILAYMKALRLDDPKMPARIKRNNYAGIWEVEFAQKVERECFYSLRVFSMLIIFSYL